MRVLRMPDDLAKRYLSVRQSYDSAFHTLQVALPDVPSGERYGFYVNAFRDLCDLSTAIVAVEEEILTAFNITGFEKIELNEIFVKEEEDDN